MVIIEKMIEGYLYKEMYMIDLVIGKKMERFILFIITLFISLIAISQDQTIGLLSYKRHLASDGYTLIYPRQQSSVFLINNCGEIVHEWEDDDLYVPNNAVYLLDNGNLLKCKKHNDGPIGSGIGEYIVEIVSWDNVPLWSYELNTENERLHHDVEMLPNGNILMIAWERKSRDEAIASGRSEAKLTNNVLYPDYIFEINPQNNEKVWEWHVWDHLIQNIDSTKLNFGSVEQHPELVDINYVENTGSLDWDWMHTNAIDYHAGLDQIMLCVPYFNEAWIIDHSTSTEEAAGHSGGLYDKGGDLLYRIGNPQSYGRGSEDDKILFFPHDTHWANEFIDSTHSNYDDIVIFNNKNSNRTSSMEIFDNPWNQDSSRYNLVNGLYLPTSFTNSIYHPQPTKFYSSGLSSAQVLPNGNILGCSGGQGYLLELSPTNEIVWEYKVPLKLGARAPQGTLIGYFQNLTFRAFKYPVYYSAFEGKDLSPKGHIEINPNISFCDSLTSSIDLISSDVNVFPNPATTELRIEWHNNKVHGISIIDLLGKKLFDTQTQNNFELVDISTYTPGVYIIIINQTFKKLFVVK